MKVTEFLLARIAEDEESARAAIGHPVQIATTWAAVAVQTHIGRWTSRRVLAECKAKRQVIDGCLDAERLKAANPGAGQMADALVGAFNALVAACEALALPYADHPDYDEAWRL